MNTLQEFEEDRLAKVARSIGWELVSTRPRRGRLAGRLAYKVVDPRLQEVVYGEQDDLELRDLRWFLEDAAKVVLPRPKKEAREKARARREPAKL